MGRTCGKKGDNEDHRRKGKQMNKVRRREQV
jgi:hypothetical protein